MAKKATKFKPMDLDTLQSIVRDEINDAVQFLDSELSGIRITADAYYRGQTSLGVEEGRSQVVVTKVRDTIQSIIPSVGRVFGATENILEFISDDEEDADICSDITEFTNSVFKKNDGFETTIVGTTDALKARIGIAQIDYDYVNVPSTPVEPFDEDDSDAENPQENAAQTEEVDTPVEAESPDEQEDDAEEKQVDQSLSARGVWSFNSVPPEEFFVNATATSLKAARIFGRRRNERIYEVIEMGIDYDDIKDLAGDDDSQIKDERNQRRQFVHDNDDSTTPDDPLSREILLTEGFIRVDFNGDGRAELRKFVAVGTNYKVVKNDPVDFHNYAVFKTSLQPHVFHPISLAEDMVQDQDAQTALLRSIIDNAALVNQPRTVLNDSTVNVDDAKNNEIGAIIRAKRIEDIRELVTPFVAGQTLPVMQYLDGVSEQRSGITKLSQGLSSDTLQSTSRVAANAAVMGGEARMEMMIRNIAETGVRDIFLIILRTAMYKMKGAVSIPTDEGKFKTVRPDLWHDHLHIRSAVGAGAGKVDDKKAALSAVAAVQQQTVQTLGLSNPIASWNNLRNTYKKLFSMAGIHNIGDYLPQIDDKDLAALDQKINQQKAQAAQQEMQQKMTEMQSYVQVELQKVNQRHEAATMRMQENMQKHQDQMATKILSLRAELAKAQGKNNTEVSLALMEDDRMRDAADQTFIANMSKIGGDIHAADADVSAPRGDLEQRAQ